MKKLNFIIFPYRNLYFRNTYGDSVRDLQIIDVIRKSKHVDSIIVVDRPISIYEYLIGRYPVVQDDYLITVSGDLLGPLKKREWTKNCYVSMVQTIKSRLLKKENTVLLDFTPMADLPLDKIEYDFYWYDLIDNFTKHDSYSNRQRLLVADKYSKVNELADLVTGVSEAALATFTNTKAILTNGVFKQSLSSLNSGTKPRFKYGFLGFISSKIDVDFVKNLALRDTTFSLFLAGEVYDKKVFKELMAIPNVHFYGAFSFRDIQNLMNNFSIGLVPYLYIKSHDGSPMKMYEYLSYGKLVLTSINYEKMNEYILNYNCIDFGCLLEAVEQYLENPRLSDVIGSLNENDFMVNKVGRILESIVKRL